MTAVTAPEPTRVRLLDELLRTAMLIRRHIEAVAAERSLTPPQARLLVLLDAPMRMQEAAHASACEPSHVTALATQLEERGLVVREADPDDRRARRLSLTEAGEAERAELLARLLDDAPVASRLGDAECDVLLRLLQEPDTGR